MSARRVLVALLASLCLALTAVTATPSPAGAATGNPVVIVPGFTTGPLVEPGYYVLRDRLRNAGYDVTLISYPDYGLGDIRTNSARLRDTVNAVRARTGATKVDLVAHSMGGLVSRYYVKSLGGSSSVDTLTMMGTPNYGTAIANIAGFFTFGSCIGITACQQMERGSSFLNSLNYGDDTIGSVRYVSIATIYDEIVIPYSTAFLANDGNLQNVTVQSQCWARAPGHLGLIFDGAVADGVRDVLRDQSVKMNCWAL